MQHNDRAKRDRHQGPKASVTIAGDAIQLVARTRGDARTRKISCQCVLFHFKQYSLFNIMFHSFSKQYVMLLFTSYVILLDRCAPAL